MNGRETEPYSHSDEEINAGWLLIVVCGIVAFAAMLILAATVDHVIKDDKPDSAYFLR